jgi:nucleoside-diphosphate-sugar epimerase
LRSGEPRTTSLDISKIARETGWSPAYDLRTTLHDLFCYWRDTLMAGREMAAD